MEWSAHATLEYYPQRGADDNRALVFCEELRHSLRVHACSEARVSNVDVEGFGVFVGLVVFCCFLLFCVAFGVVWFDVMLYGSCVFCLGWFACFACVCLQFLCVLWCVVFVVLLLEEFVVRVFKDGKVTVPKRLRELFLVEDGDYVKLALVEVLKKGDGSGWVRRRV